MRRKLSLPGGKLVTELCGDILRATEGSLSPVACLDNEPVLCQRADMCTTLSVWKGLKKVIVNQEVIDKGATPELVYEGEAEAKPKRKTSSKKAAS